MKKIGIVSIFGITNYGNRLQNYALYHFLEKQGFNVVNIIDMNLSYYIRQFIKKYLSLFLIKKKKDAKRSNLFLLFNQRIRTKNIKRIQINHFDYFICGSDQIWNPNIATDFLFLRFAEREKRIAYSASFGVSTIPNNKMEQYEKNIREMAAISVREEAGSKIIKELTNKIVPVVVDPTLLLDRKEWISISSKPKFKLPDHYILTYFLGKVSDKRNQFINKIASKHNLEIIRLESYSRNDAWYGTGPAEFLWLIEHCDIMFTDSFHGTVFSIIMRVPFIVFDREESVSNMSSRIDTLLSVFNLEDHRFGNRSEEKIFIRNYQHIQDILEIERKKSEDFLYNSLNNEL